MKVYINFRQTIDNRVANISKEVEFDTAPQVGAYFEYEDGWSPAILYPASERGMHLTVFPDGLEISGYGPWFDTEEIESLKAVGWKVSE